MPNALHVAVDDIGLELPPHPGGTLTARAYQANASLGQSFDHRDADLLGKTPDNDNAFIEIEMDHAAHLLIDRFAAASASRAWE